MEEQVGCNQNGSQILEQFDYEDFFSKSESSYSCFEQDYTMNNNLNNRTLNLQMQLNELLNELNLENDFQLLNEIFSITINYFQNKRQLILNNQEQEFQQKLSNAQNMLEQLQLLDQSQGKSLDNKNILLEEQFNEILENQGFVNQRDILEDDVSVTIQIKSYKIGKQQNNKKQKEKVKNNLQRVQKSYQKLINSKIFIEDGIISDKDKKIMDIVKQNKNYESKKLMNTVKESESVILNSQIQNYSSQQHQQAQIISEDFNLQANNSKNNQTFEVSDIQSNSEKIFQNLNYDNLVEDISQIPESSEKYILEMMKYSLDLQKQDKFEKNDLLQYLTTIEEHLKQEEQNSQEVQKCLQNLHYYVDLGDLEQVVINLNKILKIIRPLNVCEIKRLIEQQKKTAELIKDQDIILFLGKTGSGKSTTIHHLAGSKMIELQAEISPGKFIQYIGFDPKEKIKNKALQNVVIGYNATSETRFVIPVQINFSDIGMSQSGSVILCDSPGFEDTAGPEVDIANGIGIIEVIKQCRSVRPVILLSYKSIGDKGEGVKDLANFLVRFVSDIQDKLSSFSYLFTKFPENISISSELQNIKNSLNDNPEQTQVEVLNSLLDDIIGKTKKSDCIVKPLKNDFSQNLLKKLIKSEKILYPKQIFKFTLTNNSTMSIKEQGLKNQQIIIAAFKQSQFDLIKYKLDELQFLIEISEEQTIRQIQEYCLKYISNSMEQDYQMSIQELNSQIVNENKLNITSIQQYLTLQIKQQKCNNLLEKYLSNNLISADLLTENLKQQLNKMSSVFDEEIIYSQVTLNYFYNIKLISELCPQLNQVYNNINQKLCLKIDDIFAICGKALSEKRFNELTPGLKQLHQLTDFFQNCIDKDYILSKLEILKTQFKLFIDGKVFDGQQILTNQLQNDEDVNFINDLITTFEQAEQNIQLFQYINLDDVLKQKQIFMQNLSDHFIKISNRVTDIIKNEKPKTAFQILSKQINSMILFRKIKGQNTITAQLYYECIQKIQSLMLQIKNQIKLMLLNLTQENKQVDYQNIYKSLVTLKCAQWMNEVNDNYYNTILLKIQNKIYKFLKEKYDELLDIDLSYKQYYNIQSAYELMKRIQTMSILEEFFPDLSELQKTATSYFTRSIETVFSQIKSYIQSVQFVIRNYNQELRSNDKQNDHDNINGDQSNNTSFSTKYEESQQNQIELPTQVIDIQEIKVQLEQQINTQNEFQSQIQKQNDQNQNLIRINWSLMEDYLAYIETCFTCKLIKNNADILYKEVKSYLNQYGETQNQIMNECYEFIIDLNINENEESITKQKAYLLENKIQEFKNLEKKYLRVSQIVNPIYFVEQFIRKINFYYVNLYDELDYSQIDQQSQIKRIQILKSLSYADCALGDYKFFNLCQSQQQNLQKEVKENVRRTLDFIQKNDFRNASHELSQIEDNTFNKKTLNQIKNSIYFQIENLIEQVVLKLLSLSSHIEKQIIIEIFYLIEQINKARNCFKEQINPEFLICIDVKLKHILNQISEKVDKYLEKIQILECTGFQDVEDKKDHILSIHQFISKALENNSIEEKIKQIYQQIDEKSIKINEIDYLHQDNILFNPSNNILLQ